MAKDEQFEILRRLLVQFQEAGAFIFIDLHTMTMAAFRLSEP